MVTKLPRAEFAHLAVLVEGRVHAGYVVRLAETGSRRANQADAFRCHRQSRQQRYGLKVSRELGHLAENFGWRVANRNRVRKEYEIKP